MVKNIIRTKIVPLQSPKTTFLMVKFTLCRFQMSTNERSCLNVRLRTPRQKTFLTKLVQAEIRRLVNIQIICLEQFAVFHLPVIERIINILWPICFSFFIQGVIFLNQLWNCMCVEKNSFFPYIT